LLKGLGDVTVEAGECTAESAAIASPQLLRHELEAAVLEVGALRAELADRNSSDLEQRLGRLEQTMQVVAEGTEAVVETVRNFEAIISIGMIQRINDLIDQRLTVVAKATGETQDARRRQRLWALLSIFFAALLFAEIFDNGSSRLFLATGRSLLAQLSNLVTWSQGLINA
jgi:hypothetical protein